jgi:hypothetical protein
MFSWVAIDRFAEKERAKDARFRKQNADKVLRSDAKNLTDDETGMNEEPLGHRASCGRDGQVRQPE